jgi:hypothetical protein
MAVNTNPNFPPTGLPPYSINRNWCMGDSLDYINANTVNFDTRLDSLSTNITRTGTVVQSVHTTYNDLTSTSLIMTVGNVDGTPYSDAFPTKGEGIPILEATITPIYANSIIRVRANVFSVSKSNLGMFSSVAALFKTDLSNTSLYSAPLATSFNSSVHGVEAWEQTGIPHYIEYIDTISNTNSLKYTIRTGVPNYPYWTLHSKLSPIVRQEILYNTVPGSQSVPYTGLTMGNSLQSSLVIEEVKQ